MNATNELNDIMYDIIIIGLYDLVNFCRSKLRISPNIDPTLNNKPNCAAYYSENPKGLTIDEITT